MKKSEWSEKQVEELLGQMPHLTDDRDAREIYQNIILKVKKKKRRIWIIPTVTTAAALFLSILFVPNLMKNTDESSMPMTSDSSTTENITIYNDANPEQAELNTFQTADETAVYEEETVGKEVLTYVIPDKEYLFLVPVSILVSNKENQSRVSLFEKNMGQLKEKDWGLDDYYPLKAKFIYNEGENFFTVDVADKESYAMSSSTEWVFQQVLAHTIKTLNVDKIQLATNGEPGVEFGHFGLMEEIRPDESNGHQAHFYYYPNNERKKPFIVPYGEGLSTIHEAFSAMREDAIEQKLQASIPSYLAFNTEANRAKGELTIRFAKEANVYNDKATLHAIEAILLTAKEFDYEVVKLENADVNQIGRFNVHEEIPVPIAANKVQLP